MHRVPCTSRVHSHRTRVSSSTTHTHTLIARGWTACWWTNRVNARFLYYQRMGIQAVSIHMNIVVCENVTRHGHGWAFDHGNVNLGLGICGTGVCMYIYIQVPLLGFATPSSHPRTCADCFNSWGYFWVYAYYRLLFIGSIDRRMRDVPRTFRGRACASVQHTDSRGLCACHHPSIDRSIFYTCHHLSMDSF